MDGVPGPLALPQSEPELSQLLYYPDPVYEEFEGDNRTREVRYDQAFLEIKGKHLDLAHHPSDIVVRLGSQHSLCNVSRLFASRLLCVLPPAELFRDDPRQSYSVEVLVGPLKFEVGSVVFVPGSSSHAVGFSLLAAAVAVAVVAGLAYLLYRRRKRKAPLPRYRVAYRAEERQPTCGEPRRQGSRNNDYHDMRGRFLQQLSRPAPAAPPCAEEAPAVDDETMHLLQSENILVQRECLTLGEIIGEGHFGCVYRGDLRLPGKEETIQVAVKTLHNSSSSPEQDVDSFLQEGLMMKDFHHHHVLTLIGVCFEGSSPMVVIPFMQNGDLHSFIRDESNKPTVKELLTFGVQIASGMKYLAELKFVHRDLAARNCMLDADMNVKVADFGLSRDIYERDYYSSDNKKTKLPVKWMAPESLEKGTYTTKTDGWSYGVVLWELMTRGVTPYPDVDNWDILQYLKLGRRMPQPSYCPDLLYEIMLRCWSEDSADRPTFAELEEEVEGVITKLQGMSSQKTIGLNVTYVNYPRSLAEGARTVDDSR